MTIISKGRRAGIYKDESTNLKETSEAKTSE
jgi:hypothetical protein